MYIFLIGIGVLILILTFSDFFHTTISGNGFGILSGRLNLGLGKLILKFKRDFFFNYSGYIHLLSTTFMWLFLLILGTFIIFVSGSEMVVNADTKMPATFIDRFYYTCYLVSTMGNGDFIPGNDVSRIFSAVLSFSGFILLTTAMTFLISIINSVLHKKELAFYINAIGNDIEKIYSYTTTESDLNPFSARSTILIQMINKNASNYLTFPIIRFFMTRRRSAAIILQLVILYEVLTVVRENSDSKSFPIRNIDNIISAMEFYLKLDFGRKMSIPYNPEAISALRRGFWQKQNIDYHGNPEKDKVMNAALSLSGWTWKDVYLLQE